MDYKFSWKAFLLLLSLPVLASAAHPVVSVSTGTQSHAAVALSTTVVSSSHTWRSVPNTAFRAGEDLKFVIRWGLISGGRSSLAIKGTDLIAGRPAYHIVSQARSTGLVNTFYKTRDLNEAWLDVESLVTVRYEKHIHEGRYRIEEVVELDQVNQRYHDFSKRLDKGTTEMLEGPTPPNVMDVLGSLYYVRTMPLAVGQSYTFDVYEGNKIWPLVVNVQKRETISVPAGKFDCYRVEPVLREPGIFISKGKKLQVWLTADDSHMPVLMRSEIFIGHVSAELVSYGDAVPAGPNPPPGGP